MRFPPNHHSLQLCVCLLALGLWSTFTDGAPPPAADEQALGEIAQLLAAKEWSTAADQARSLVENAKPAKTRLTALEHLATALAGLGNPEESRQTTQRAEALFRELEKTRLAKSKVYFRNRSALDGTRQFAIDLLGKRQAAAKAAGHAEGAAAIAVALAQRFPTHHRHRTFALEAAEQLLALGRQDEAAPWFVAALDTGLDCAFMAKAALRDNQVQLDAVAKPLPLDLVRRALVGLAGNPKGVLASAAESFHAALVLTRLPDDSNACEALNTLLAKQSPGHGVPASIVRLELARTHLRNGRVPEARETLARIEIKRDAKRPGPGTHRQNAIASHTEFLLGMVANAELDREKAVEHFAQAATRGGGALAEQARYEQARSLELGGQWSKARRIYQELAANARADSIRRAAGISLPRLDAVGQAPLPKSGDAVTQLPDDRETRGDWYLGYGTECFQLACLTHHGSNIKLPLALSTSDPKERGRQWTSAKDSADPAAIWSPSRRWRVAANFDDFGGQYPIGAGPDLLIDTAIPKEQHILSLYFANDNRYYETSRRYTIEMRTDGELLALAEVRDFGGGVYKRFLVTGPRNLQIRLRRDASLNTLFQGAFLDPVPTLNPSPVQLATGAAPDQGTYGKYGRRLTRRAANLARPGPLVAFANSLAAKREPSLADRRYQSYQLLLAAGRPRTAQRDFKAFAKTIPKEQALAVARELGRQLPQTASSTSCQPRDWPDGTHPLDILNERWLDKYLITPADPQRTKTLLELLGAPEPYVTPFARKQAFLLLDRHAPKQLSPAILLAAAGRSEKAREESQAAVFLRRALAAKPAPDIELRVSSRLLDMAPQAQMPVPEIRVLYARILVLAKQQKAKHLLPIVHLHAAEAFAAQGEYEEAIALLDHAPPNIADSMAKMYQRKLNAKLKGK